MAATQAWLEVLQTYVKTQVCLFVLVATQEVPGPLLPASA